MRFNTFFICVINALGVSVLFIYDSFKFVIFISFPLFNCCSRYIIIFGTKCLDKSSRYNKRTTRIFNRRHRSPAISVAETAAVINSKIMMIEDVLLPCGSHSIVSRYWLKKPKQSITNKHPPCISIHILRELFNTTY